MSKEQLDAIEALHKAHAECREEAAELRVTMHSLYAMIVRHHELLRQLGHDLGPMPQLPTRPR